MTQITESLTRPDLNWDLINLFCLAADNGSVRKTSRISGLSIATVRKRLEQLEGELGVHLFHRHNRGLALTIDGQQVLKDARAARQSIANIGRLSFRKSAATNGLITMSLTEGLGIFWMTPRLQYFKTMFPNVILDYQCTLHPVDINQGDADIAVQYTKPVAENLIGKKLGTLHNVLFCTQSYIEKYGAPKTVSDLKHHRFAYQVSEQTDESGLLRVIGASELSGIVQYKVNSSFALYQLVRTDNVIGLLPTYTAALTDDLVHIPLETPESLPLEIWLSYHEDVREFQPALALIEWIKNCFDSKQFPWFREEFLSPRTIAKLDKSLWKETVLTFTRDAHWEN